MSSVRRTRSRARLPLLVALLVAVPIVEVWLLIQVGHGIGVLPTVAILVVEALVGAWLLRREGRRAYAALTNAFATGRMPTVELADAALVLVGGVLLMLPGFASDLVGLCCLLPFSRPWARRLLGLVVSRQVQQLGHSRLPPIARDNLIKGETVDPLQRDSAKHDQTAVTEVDEGHWPRG